VTNDLLTLYLAVAGSERPLRDRDGSLFVERELEDQSTTGIALSKVLVPI